MVDEPWVKVAYGGDTWEVAATYADDAVVGGCHGAEMCNGCGKRFLVGHPISCLNSGLFLELHDEAAK